MCRHERKRLGVAGTFEEQRRRFSDFALPSVTYKRLIVRHTIPTLSQVVFGFCFAINWLMKWTRVERARSALRTAIGPRRFKHLCLSEADPIGVILITMEAEL